jgi:hypothetical protein
MLTIERQKGQELRLSPCPFSAILTSTGVSLTGTATRNTSGRLASNSICPHSFMADTLDRMTYNMKQMYDVCKPFTDTSLLIFIGELLNFK